MPASTANNPKPKTWGQLTVRQATRAQVDQLRSEYMTLRGAYISDDAIVQHLLKGKSAKDLPKPPAKSMDGR